MDRSADAVVIGSGITGASIAFNLLKQGLKKVVIVKKYLIASGGRANRPRSSVSITRMNRLFV